MLSRIGVSGAIKSKLLSPISARSLRCSTYASSTPRGVSQRVHKRVLGIASRGYHTYPDPDEVPVITNHIADKTKPLPPDPSLPAHTPVVKSGGNFDSMAKKFCMTRPFELPPHMHSTPFAEQPVTRSRTLGNGLVVASQDMPGLMCSITLLVKTGRWGSVSHDTHLVRPLTTIFIICMCMYIYLYS
jgi:hypothetical protein